ncbi:5' nucleotidase family protein [Galdieria sulphuraria]|uniref:5' nucleotidase family protein n=1 Tax=Galdieria sulphuraria TaxID=130081 RepID=M2Y294_GALSU|nr:5' nucleotidase family protein [Galdieria sulphuraria]EME29929.1 5' nucleotidase family protein [Galdieria sulphuraria]|eukprot:XP_005706449.1 5' nucleotidase family protein [Galdieria sulphuraria]
MEGAKCLVDHWKALKSPPYTTLITKCFLYISSSHIVHRPPRSYVFRKQILFCNTRPPWTPNLQEDYSKRSLDDLLGYQGEIFCNRSLNMQSIEAVGFDMDYTLAQYTPETFEVLAYEGALKRLVSIGYPKQILDWKYDPSYYLRGLIIDKARGNILKMDRHKYVKLAYHGFKPLTKSQREKLYDQEPATPTSLHDSNYVPLDTLFSLPDAYLFSQLIRLADEHPQLLNRSYSSIFDDVRKAVDICHRDGYIKDKVAIEPSYYVEKDPYLFDTLKLLKKSGRKLFLLTNSLWEYTNVLMNYLWGNPSRVYTLDWMDYFDLVIVGAAKPTFLVDSNLPLYRVDPYTGQLKNAELFDFHSDDNHLVHGKLFQGGNWKYLHHLLKVSSGSSILYVGDHMYSDILRTKLQLGWRTMLVIPELEREVNMMQQLNVQRQHVDELRRLRDDLDEWLDRLESELVHREEVDSESRMETIQAELDQARKEYRRTKEALDITFNTYDSKFHPIWGQLFKTGYQNSYFAHQVETYACLYTSRVSNIRLVSPEIHFRCMVDYMPHDRLEEAPFRRLMRRRLRLRRQMLEEKQSEGNDSVKDNELESHKKVE